MAGKKIDDNRLWLKEISGLFCSPVDYNQTFFLAWSLAYHTRYILLIKELEYSTYFLVFSNLKPHYSIYILPIVSSYSAHLDLLVVSFSEVRTILLFWFFWELKLSLPKLVHFVFSGGSFSLWSFAEKSFCVTFL